MIKLEYEGHFDAAHYLPNYEGKCANLHGHRWTVKVILVGFSNPDTGMLMDFTKIKEIIDKLDHKLLNDIIKNPTAENIAEWIYNRFPRKIVIKVELWETPNSKVTYYETDPSI